MNIPTKTRCPFCGSRGAPIKGGNLLCRRCRAIYDDKPLEHGRALHTDPERNAEIMEQDEQWRNRKR
jgi:hypothetical protein